MNSPTIRKMTDITTCPICGSWEFYGELVWGPDHKAICRACIYKDWQMRDPAWDPKTAPVFPAYRTTPRFKTKAQQIESLQAAQALAMTAIKDLTTEATGPAQNGHDPEIEMLLSAAQILQDATEWLEGKDL